MPKYILHFSNSADAHSTFRCVSYGVLSADEAAGLHEAILNRKKRSGLLSAPPTKKSRKSSSKVAKDVAVDAGLQVGGEEGVGISTL